MNDINVLQEMQMYCRKCGIELSNDAAFCRQCGTSVVGPRTIQQQTNDDKALGYIVPVGTSALSIVAGYLGLFSVLLVPAPFAILLGILALKDLKKNPRPHGKGRAIFAIIMGTVCTILFLFLILMPR